MVLRCLYIVLRMCTQITKTAATASTMMTTTARWVDTKMSFSSKVGRYEDCNAGTHFKNTIRECIKSYYSIVVTLVKGARDVGDIARA